MLPAHLLSQPGSPTPPAQTQESAKQPSAQQSAKEVLGSWPPIPPPGLLGHPQSARSVATILQSLRLPCSLPLDLWSPQNPTPPVSQLGIPSQVLCSSVSPVPHQELDGRPLFRQILPCPPPRNTPWRYGQGEEVSSGSCPLHFSQDRLVYAVGTTPQAEGLRNKVLFSLTVCPSPHG